MRISNLALLSILFKLSLSKDFYVGMLRKNDKMIAQDIVFKEKSPFGYTTASYGRTFNCTIVYLRVADRLGVGRPPTVMVTRGGLLKNYITLRLTAAYGMPIAVNVYVGCEVKKTPKPTLRPEIEDLEKTTPDNDEEEPESESQPETDAEPESNADAESEAEAEPEYETTLDPNAEYT